eukprot:g4132.t1
MLQQGSPSGVGVNNTIGGGNGLNVNLDPSKIRDVLSMLVTLRDARTTETLRAVNQQFEALSVNPEFGLYLTHVFVYGLRYHTDLRSNLKIDLRSEEGLRAVGGLVLKRTVDKQWRNENASQQQQNRSGSSSTSASPNSTGLTTELKNYIKACILLCLLDTAPMIRKTGANIIATVVRREQNLALWPQLLEALLVMSQSPCDPSNFNPNAHVNTQLTPLSMAPANINFSSNEDETNAFRIAGPMRSLFQICEDQATIIVRLAEKEQRSLNSLVSTFLNRCFHRSSDIRQFAVKSLNAFLPIMPVEIAQRIPEILQTLSRLAGMDTTPEVRALVCTSINLILETDIQHILPILDSILNFMLEASKDPHKNVALVACEFWATAADACSLEIYEESGADPYAFFETLTAADLMPSGSKTDNASSNGSASSSSSSSGNSAASLAKANQARGKLRQALLSSMPQILPVLVSRMVYSEEEIIDLGGEEDIANAHIADKPEDIKPIFYRRAKGKGTGNSSSHNNEDDDDGQGDPDDEEDNDDGNNASGGFGSEDEPTSWTVRKSASVALDLLASAFGDQLLPLLFPLLQEKLAPSNPSSTHWTVQESGILVLGAISDGCPGIQRHLHEIFPFLLNIVDATVPHVRCIACWTISRLAKWIIGHEVLRRKYQTLQTLKQRAIQEGGQDVAMHDERIRQWISDLDKGYHIENICDPQANYFEGAMVVLTRRCVDHNKRVQKSGCSAFTVFLEAVIENNSGRILVPYTEPIVSVLAKIIASYQASVLIVAWDALEAVCEACGRVLHENDNLLKLLMEPIMMRWHLTTQYFQSQEVQNTQHGVLYADSLEMQALGPLLNAIQNIACVVKQKFAPYAMPVFQHCVKIMEDELIMIVAKNEERKLVQQQKSDRQQHAAFHGSSFDSEYDDDDDDESRDWLISALDTLSVLTEALQGSMVTLITGSKLMEMLNYC